MPDLDPWPSCTHCTSSMLLHSFKGAKLRCSDGYLNGFHVWDVVALKRSLGHKISPTMSHNAHKAESEHLRLQNGH